MFGLSALEHVVQPKSTLEKLWFLLEHAFTRAHELTTLISFGALGVLVGFRAFKQAFKRYWFIYRLPEVFIVVVASTSASVLSVLAFPLYVMWSLRADADWRCGIGLDSCWMQCCRTSGGGTRTESRSSGPCPSAPAPAPSSSSRCGTSR